MTNSPCFKLKASILGAFILLAACSGSGGGSSPPPPPPNPPPPPPSGPVWTQGVFQAASTFKDRCQAPRVGVDIEGNRFPDLAGSLLQELFWLRSWTNETYLWNNEVVDRDPATFSDRLAYFDVLRTTAVTPSGKDKDDFHFSQPTEEYLRERNSAPLSGYGARFVGLSATRPRDFRVGYTDANTPASQDVGGAPALIRGDRILEVDGVDLVNASSQADIDILNNGLFPATAGETHTFLVRHPVTAATRTVTLTSANLVSQPVNRTRIIDTPSGRVGYILLNTFSPFSTEEAARQAILAMDNQNVADLVLDLRYNGGGLLAIAAQLSYMVAGPARASGRTFEQLRFNTGVGGRNPVTGATDNAIPFYSTGLGFSTQDGLSLPDLNLPRVFVLTTARTCSASEAVINGLRGINVEVILIGATTCGKPFGFYPQDNCGETYYTIQFQGVNDVSFGDYADGFAAQNSSNAFAVKAPGCAVADDFSRELGDTGEGLLAAALGYRATGACPAPSAVAAQGRGLLEGLIETGEVGVPDIAGTNRDMRLPQDGRL